MLGLIAKVLLALVLFIAVIVVALNQTGTATWGTISVHTPDIAPCQREASVLPSKPVLVEVRWAWVVKNYGWGCYFEFGDDSKATIVPMPQ